MVIISRSEYALRRAAALVSVAAAGNKEEFCCIPSSCSELQASDLSGLSGGCLAQGTLRVEDADHARVQPFHFVHVVANDGHAELPVLRHGADMWKSTPDSVRWLKCSPFMETMS